MIRRLFLLLLCLAIMAGIAAVPASADSMAGKVESYVTVTNNGDCMVSTTVRLRKSPSLVRTVFTGPLSPSS